MSTIAPPTDPRKAGLEAWLATIDRLADVRIEPASADASFRRYFRCYSGSESFIAMDAPPANEDSVPFVRVAGYLESMGLNAPRILEVDLERGFLLLTDLGSEPYLNALAAQRDDEAAIDGLYGDAMAALQRIQSAGAAYQASLPPYDAKLLSFELSLFHDWLCGTHLGIEFSTAEEMAWRDLCSLLIANALDQPQVFVHRDYHSRNLMVCRGSNPGIIDFQDAVEGPLTYDLVSLLKDCYITWPAERVRDWALGFHAALPEDTQRAVGRRQFLRYFELMGVQRHIKAAGIFARLNHRDGKSAYLRDVPRTVAYILEVAPRYEELAFLGSLIEERVLPSFDETS